ncbi:MAG: hypothetical protein AAB634_02720 [Patescibacteria group bacterium]
MALQLQELAKRVGKRLAYQAYIEAGGKPENLPNDPDGWRIRYLEAEESECRALHGATTLKTFKEGEEILKIYQELGIDAGHVLAQMLQIARTPEELATIIYCGDATQITKKEARARLAEFVEI